MNRNIHFLFTVLATVSFILVNAASTYGLSIKFENLFPANKLVVSYTNHSSFYGDVSITRESSNESAATGSLEVILVDKFRVTKKVFRIAYINSGSYTNNALTLYNIGGSITPDDLNLMGEPYSVIAFMNGISSAAYPVEMEPLNITTTNAYVNCGSTNPTKLTATSNYPTPKIEWTLPDGSKDTARTITVSVPNVQNSTYKYILKISDHFNRSVSKDIYVTVIQPVMTVSSSSYSVCPYENFTISADAPGATHFYWEVTGVAGSEGQIYDNPYTTNIVTTKTYKATAIYQSGCSTQTKELEIKVLPTTLSSPTITQTMRDGTGCPNDPSNSWIIKANSNGATAYYWTYKDWNNVWQTYPYRTPEVYFARNGRINWFPEFTVYANNKCTSSPTVRDWATIKYYNCAKIVEPGEDLGEIDYSVKVENSIMEIGQTENDNISVNLIAIDGSIAKKVNTAERNTWINLSNIQSGIYVLTISGKNGVARKKISINN